MGNAPFWIEGATIAVIAGTGIYSLVTRRNLFKMLIGVNILSKAVTFSFAVGSKARADVGFGQSLMIAAMVAEVVVTAVTLSIMVNIYRHYGSLDVRDLKHISE